jgi:hypothetical protein
VVNLKETLNSVSCVYGFVLLPDLVDMGFEMVYGQVPPPFEEDPVENSLALQIFC